jgi:hypothetical protein
MNKDKFYKALDEAVLALQDEIVEGKRFQDQWASRSGGMITMLLS